MCIYVAKTETLPHTIQQGRRNPCSGADSYFVNVCGKVLSKRHANCQHNRLVLAQQAHNLQRHLSKVHSKDLDPMYHAHLCSKLQYNTVELLYYKHLVLQMLPFAILLFNSEYRSILFI